MISDRMADVLRGLRSVDGVLAAECAELLGADGVAVSLVVEGGVTELVWCSSGVSSGFEELQFTLGEGPGPDALRSGVMVLEPDLPAVRSDRWPALLPAADLLPVRAVFCFPLGAGAIRVGVLTVLRSVARPLSEQEMADALVLSTALTMRFLGGSSRRLDSWLRAESPGVLRRAVVHQATGMISVQLAVPLEEALLRLRAFAYRQDRSIGEAAEDVVARRLRFSHDMAGPHSPGETRG
ncbi:GAF and ANTAR domain-containing protein [Streptomyces sp. H10-C2]|uniref:GAF and ANTAR domain-containing protein n=1 Tax=unclassified Streptomyces TaxID=2593676 RepID=UPI0024BB5CB9|nr:MULTISPECIES: GAF and ANTAR domain-containing protein [unclassified Streptomyces]MDJ0342314.1 GAF and ANTAR domain-containing protein [Streptomyces sp. PH10-H1]MDJ0372169.1 GAF and ANTAR domain-containing protein [Streptomyces sp. H10-C2]